MHRTKSVRALALLPLALGCAEGDLLGPSAAGPGEDNSTFDCSVTGGMHCEGDVAVECSQGGLAERTDCAALGLACIAGVGCAACVPGEGTCANGVATACRADGSGMADFECDTEQGMVCEPDGCKGACSPAVLGASYIGCDYYPTVTLNTGVWSGFPFAVAISNTGGEPSNVTITRGAEFVAARTVTPGNLEIVELPWVMDLKGPDPNFLGGTPGVPPPPSVITAGAYRLKSDRPITVYQFSPLDYALDPPPPSCLADGTNTQGCYSYSNDASLLLPAHVLTGNYVAMSWNSLGCKAGFITVTATQNDTWVELSPVGEFAHGGGIDENGQGKARLDAGDVIQLTTPPLGGPFCFDYDGSDLSGTRVSATKPVQVISGHACANLPTPKTQACDHLEEAMFPIETLGTDYVVTVPTAPAGPAPYTLRIAAIEADTHVTLDPPHGDVPLLAPGVPFELRYLTEDVRVTSDKPILVAEYMQGSDSVPGETGDPSESLAIAREQYRNDYVFAAPTNYDQSFVNIVARQGQSVLVDGAAIPGGAFTPVGASDLAAARVELAKNGTHTASSSEPFGITVYGYGRYTSYMYPGGLDLGRITEPPPR